MKATVALVVYVIGTLGAVESQSPTSDCTVINQHFYGFEGSQQRKTSTSDQVEIPLAVGPPGKAGVRGFPGRPGAPGPKGEVGEKGKGGDSLEENKKTRELERKVEELEQFKSEVLAIPKTCDYVNGSESESGMYWINPGLRFWGAFQVYCLFSAGSATTMIGHDQEAETEVTCNSEQCHRSDVTYQATDRQIRALIEASGSCRQFIKYRCKGSVLVWDENTPYAAWISARGTKKYNWDGSVSDYFCACSQTETCLPPGNSLRPPRCNCDNNSNSRWTSDEGYLTSKADLPVKALLFGDGGDRGEQGFHTLGKLECSGRG